LRRSPRFIGSFRTGSEVAIAVSDQD